MKGRIDSRNASSVSKQQPLDNRMTAHSGFQDILAFIQQSRFRALQSVNRELVDLYWRIGEHLSQHIQTDGWGHGTVEDLAAWIPLPEPVAETPKQGVSNILIFKRAIPEG